MTSIKLITLAIVAIAIATETSAHFWWKNKHGGGILGGLLPSIKIGTQQTHPVQKPQEKPPPTVVVEAEWVCQSTRTGEVVYVPPQQGPPQSQQQPNYPPQQQPNYPPPQQPNYPPQQPNYPPQQQQPNYPPQQQPQQPNYPPQQQQPQQPNYNPNEYYPTPGSGQKVGGDRQDQFQPPVNPNYPPPQQVQDFPPKNLGGASGDFQEVEGLPGDNPVNTNGQGMIDVRFGEDKN